MKDWFAVCAVGLVIIVGTAAGLGGTLAFLLAFGVTWYLLTARDIGFAKARDTLGIKLLPPIWRRSNWRWLGILFDDGEKLFKAATIALVVISAALMFEPDIVYGAAMLIAAFYVSEILRGKTRPPRRLVRILDAGAKVAEIENTPVAVSPQAPIIQPVLTMPVEAAPEPARPTSGGAAVVPEVARPISRVIVGRLRAARKPLPPRQRRVDQRPPGAKRTNPAKRSLRNKAKRPERSASSLPSRKPDYPIAIRTSKPLRRLPGVRRRTMRKPVTQLPRRSAAQITAAAER